MNIAYLTIILLTIYLFTTHNRKTNKEFFKTDYSKTLKTIRNSINLLNMKYIDIQSKVMANYKFTCTEKEIKKPKKKVVKVTEEEELDNLTRDLYKLQEDTEKQETSKKRQEIRLEPVIKKPKRLDYDTLTRDIFDKDDLEDIDETEYIPKRISEQIKLNNFLKCYNKNKKYR